MPAFRDQMNSNNLFHWHMHKNLIDQNTGGGFEIMLPYVWSYNENYTHTVVLGNNTMEFNKNFAFIIDGHYAQVNLTNNQFQNNICKGTLVKWTVTKVGTKFCGHSLISFPYQKFKFCVHIWFSIDSEFYPQAV